MAHETDPRPAPEPFPMNLSLDLDVHELTPQIELVSDEEASPPQVPPAPAATAPEQNLELAEPDESPALELAEPEGPIVVSPSAKLLPPRPAPAPAPVADKEVRDLQCKSQLGRIELSWRPPAGATGIEVWRLENLPPARGQGVLLDSVTLTDARDRDVIHGQTYGYRVVCVFDGPRGEPIYSAGATATATARGEAAAPPAEKAQQSIKQLFAYGGGLVVVMLILVTALNSSRPAKSRPQTRNTRSVAQDSKPKTPMRITVADLLPERKPEPEQRPKPQPEPQQKADIPQGDPRNAAVPATPPVRPSPRPRDNPPSQKPRIVPLEGEEAFLFTYPPADQQQWEQAWRRNLKVSVTLKLSGRMSGQNRALPTVVGLHAIHLQNESPFLIRIVAGPAKSLETSARKRLEIPPGRSLGLTDPSHYANTKSIDLRITGERGGTVAAVRRGPLCTIEVVPDNGQKPLRLQMEYAFTVNRDNDVLSARYVLHP